MRRTIATAIIALLIYGSAFAQLQKFYTVAEDCSYDNIYFSLVATSGQCKIESSNHPSSLDIYGSADIKKATAKLVTNLRDGIKHVNLNFEKNSSGVLDMFSGGNNEESWLIDLNANKKVMLNLDYGYGTSNIDLSNTKVSQLKINTGSADVYISYGEDKWNLCNMDTFQVKVEMGSLITENLCHTKARTYLADIGFGTAVLDLSERNHDMMNIKASVGAGSLEIHTPRDEIPTIIIIKKSPLCHIKLPKGFKEIRKNTFVNKVYAVDAKDLRSFEIDVALGNISFLPPIVH